MKKNLRVMDDPKLDKIFTEAYLKSIKEIQVRERDKELEDHIDAFAEMFDQELAHKDLTVTERREVVDAMKEYIRNADERRIERKRSRMKSLTIALSVTFGTLGVAALIFLAAAKPFTPVTQIESELMYYYEKVDDGYGGFAKKYYRVLNRYDRKLGAAKSSEYKVLMYDELEEHYTELLQRVENGEIAYYDDVKDWAGYFPEVEERDARKELANNALQKGFGKNVGKSFDTIKDGALNLLEKAKNYIEDEVKEP